MACIRKRNKKWIVDYRIGHFRKTPSFDTKAEAEAFKRELLLRPIDNIIGYQEIKDVLLEDASQEYLARVSQRKSERTLEVDSVALRRLCSGFKGASLSQISMKDIENFQLNLAKSLNTSTVNRQFNVIRHFFKKCTEWNYLKQNPTLGIPKLKEKMTSKTPLTADQINKIISALPDWAKNAYLLIAKTGLRRGQACALKWIDVDLSKKVFTTHSSKGGVLKAYQIPMTDEVFSLILQLWNRKTQLSIQTEFVLLGVNDKGIKPPSLTQAVLRLRSKLNISNAGLHILRHTLLTRLAESNQNGATIQRLAGHSSLRTTEQYIHMDHEVLRQSLQEIEKKERLEMVRIN